MKKLTFSLFFSFPSLFQWICTINNISKQIYLSENPEVTSLKLIISVMSSDTDVQKIKKGSTGPNQHGIKLSTSYMSNLKFIIVWFDSAS